MPGAAPTIRATSWLPSSWISTRPDWNAGPSVTGRRPSMRRPQGENGVGFASQPSAASAALRLVAVAFQQVDPQIQRGGLRQRRHFG